MAEFIVLSKMTLTMEEGTVAKWLVKEGDSVKLDDPLCSVENEKETEDILSIYEGTILKLLAEEGEVYPVNTPIAVIGEAGEDITALMDSLSKQAEEKKEEEAAAVRRVVSQAKNVQGKMMPKIRKLIQQKGIDEDELAAFCAGRKITEEEIAAFEQKKSGGAQKKAIEVGENDRVVKASAMRKTVAKNMVESCEHTARLTNIMEVDMTAASALVKKLKADGKRVSMTAFIMKAAAYALKEFEVVNTSYLEESGEIIYRGDINISCAVDLPEGLAVPVVMHADKRDIFDITGDIDLFAQKGKEGKISNDEMKNGTFTISNIGMMDVLIFTPIINYPQTAILGVGTLRTLPRYVDDACTVIEPRKIMQIAITYDHRVIDGAPAGRFLRSIRTLLEEPEKLV
ncbi:MAG: dihydrolipoamide acetyltransferase family protein [Christensenella sp.]|nr:dihydrolipoamide acetyltransferase family protein [Christensenella sp.]